MIKKFSGPGGYYIQDNDVGPDPFTDKLLDNPFNCDRYMPETWDKPEMRSDYREINFAIESLSPKEYSGPGEIYEDMMYKRESGKGKRMEAYEMPKYDTENENFGRKRTKEDEKEEKSDKKGSKSSRRRQGMD